MTVQKKQWAIYQIFWECPKQNPTGIKFCIIIIIIEFRWLEAVFKVLISLDALWLLELWILKLQLMRILIVVCLQPDALRVDNK